MVRHSLKCLGFNMVQILPKVPGFGESMGAALGGGFGQAFGSGMNQAAQFAQQLKLEEAKKRSMLDAMQNEKFETGLDVIKGMKELVAKGNLGRGSGFMGLFGGETAKDRAEYEQLGKSLIPLVAAGVPVRNQKEFEEYKKVITDPSAPDAAIEGALSGLERIFEQKLASGEQQKTAQGKGKGKVKFDISNPEHKAKRNQLLKRFKNDRAKVKEYLDKEFEEEAELEQ